jgi:arsenate reductase
MSADLVGNILFLCTGTSARSIMGEAIVNQLGKARFCGYSAGSKPKGIVHPLCATLLQSLGHSTESLRSKSWDEFAEPGAPKMDFVFTVCDRVAQELCAVWPGQPLTATWILPDPSTVTGSDADRAAAFAEAYGILRHRIQLFLALPFAALDRASLQQRIRVIGQQ